MVLKQVHDTNMRAKGHPERVFSVSYSSSHSPLQSPLGPFLDAHSHPQTTLQFSGTPRHLSVTPERKRCVERAGEMVCDSSALLLPPGDAH